ncbi:MAG: hypothetical protein K8T89_24605 [Planctomycetes bacterium]|nr:hypothetical protein [Planctomycetota bacterium]
MAIQLSLSSDLETRLHAAASDEGMSAEQYAVEAIEEKLPVSESPAVGNHAFTAGNGKPATLPEEKPPLSAKTLAAIAMLKAWAKEAEEMTDEESAENEAILRAIDENRLSDRKLFTEILSDKSP